MNMPQAPTTRERCKMRVFIDVVTEYVDTSVTLPITRSTADTSTLPHHVPGQEQSRGVFEEYVYTFVRLLEAKYTANASPTQLPDDYLHNQLIAPACL